MNTYGFRLLDFTPNAVVTMAIFAHLCENFVRVHPNVALFRHFFMPRVEKGEPLPGGIAWISRAGKKGAYLEGELRSKWEEWRADWCWIVEEDPQPFTARHQAPVVRGNDWSNVAPDDDRLRIAITRIQRLRLAGLTVGAVGADFLCRRIAPLQERRRPAWEFKNAADIMRLRPGLNFNLTVLELNAMLQELFKCDPDHPELFRLPQGVVPLCNNSSLDRIRAMMPLCDSHGIVPTWQEPADDVVQEFFDGLVEVPVRADEQRSLTHDTTEEELQCIATRLEEATAAAAAGEFGFTVEEAEAAEAAEAASLAEREELAGEGELAGPEAESSEPAEDTGGSLEINSSSSPPSDNLLQAEPPAPPRRRLRKVGDVAERQTSQQPPRRTTRSTAASTGAGSSRTTASAPAASHAAAAAGAGSSQTIATAPAKRPREPTPPPRRVGGEPGFYFSALSSDEEEEEPICHGADADRGRQRGERARQYRRRRCHRRSSRR
ncbi:hypothetical protein VPH35_071183 [Triticum aestivum]